MNVFIFISCCQSFTRVFYQMQPSWMIWSPVIGRCLSKRTMFLAGTWPSGPFAASLNSFILTTFLIHQQSQSPVRRVIPVYLLNHTNLIQWCVINRQVLYASDCLTWLCWVFEHIKKGIRFLLSNDLNKQQVWWRRVFYKRRNEDSYWDQCGLMRQTMMWAHNSFPPHLQPIICPTAFTSNGQTLTRSSCVLLYKEKERAMIKVPERWGEGKQV